MLRTIIRNLLKPLSFLPAIFLMYMIFSFSAQDGATSAQLSYKVSYKIVETGGRLLGADFEPWEIENLANRFHGPVRKLAHMSEYFALAVSVAFPLYVYGLRGILLVIVAGFFCVAFACADEYHQSLVAGRTPSKKDVMIDSAGVFFGIIFTRIVGWTGRKTIFRPLTKKNKRKAQEQLPYAYQNQVPQGQPPYGYPNQGPQGQPLYTCQNQMPQGQPPYGYPNQMPQGQPLYTCQNQMPQGQPLYTSQNQVPQGQPPYGYPNQMPRGPYGSASYMEVPQNQERSSDRLSEDMSFKKLMTDLKDKKQMEHHLSRKPKMEKSDLNLDEDDWKSVLSEDEKDDITINEIHLDD